MVGNSKKLSADKADSWQCCQKYLGWVDMRHVPSFHYRICEWDTMPAQIQYLKRKGGRIQHLTVEGVLLATWTSKVFQVVARSCPNFESLHCTNCELDGSLFDVLLKCTKIKKLRLNEPKIDTSPSSVPTVKCPNIVSLEFAYNDVLLSLALVGMRDNLTHLQYYGRFDLENTHRAFESCAVRWSDLRWLSLHKANSEYVGTVAENCRALTCLVEDECIVQACQKLSCLHSLSVSSTGVTDETLRAIREFCSAKLRRLYVANCNVSLTEVHNTLLQCPLITMLGIPFESSDLDDPFTLPHTTSSAVTYCSGEEDLLEVIPFDYQTLQRLHISGKQSPQGFENVIARCPQLRLLRIDVGIEPDYVPIPRDTIKKWRSMRPGLTVHEDILDELTPFVWFFDEGDEEFFMTMTTYAL